MANLIIKPSSGGDLVIKGSDDSPAITVGATGTTTFAENATMSGTLGVTGNTTLSGSANNLGTVTAGVWSGTAIAAAKGGGVRQFVQKTTTTETDGTISSNTSTLMTDFDVSITPKLSDSRILVNFNCGGMINNYYQAFRFDIKRIMSSVTTTVRTLNRYSYASFQSSNWFPHPISLHYLDDTVSIPSTPVVIKYVLYFQMEIQQAVELNPNGGTNCGVITAMELAPN